MLTGSSFVAAGTGAATHLLALPPGFPGAKIVAQAAVLDASPPGFTLGNAALLVLQ